MWRARLTSTRSKAGEPPHEREHQDPRGSGTRVQGRKTAKSLEGPRTSEGARTRAGAGRESRRDDREEQRRDTHERGCRISAGWDPLPQACPPLDERGAIGECEQRRRWTSTRGRTNVDRLGANTSVPPRVSDRSAEQRAARGSVDEASAPSEAAEGRSLALEPEARPRRPHVGRRRACSRTRSSNANRRRRARSPFRSTGRLARRPIA